MGETETGKQNEPEAELNPSWLLPGMGLPARCFTPPSLPLLPASQQTLVGFAEFTGGQGLCPPSVGTGT